MALGEDLPVGIWIARVPTGQEVYVKKTFSEIMGAGMKPDARAGNYSAPYGIFTRDGKPYRLFPLPWAQPILDEDRRLAASYANFLIVDGAVLMPSYGDPADARAAEVLENAFPGRDIVQVPCRPLIWQNGSLHCITMQLPQGLVR